MLKTIIYTKIEQKLIEDWTSLWDNSTYANYTNSPYWFLSAIETFGYKDFRIVAVYKDTLLAAVAALVKKRMYGVEYYTVAPEDFTCGLPFLIDFQDKNLLKTLLAELLELGNIFIKNVPEPFVYDLKQQTKKITVIKNTLNYYLNFNKDNTGQVVIRHKKRLIRQAKDIEKELKVKSFDNDITDGLQAAFDIDNKSRKQSRGYNAFSDEQIKTFYRSLAKHFKEKFSLNILFCEKKPVAYHIGFNIQNTFYCSQIASLREYGRYSLDRVLLINIFESMGQKGTEKINFGSGDNLFKRSFSKNSDQLYIVIISKKTTPKLYIRLMTQLKKIIFNYLFPHKRIYFLYCRIKHIL